MSSSPMRVTTRPENGRALFGEEENLLAKPLLMQLVRLLLLLLLPLLLLLLLKLRREAAQ